MNRYVVPPLFFHPVLLTRPAGLQCAQLASINFVFYFGASLFQTLSTILNPLLISLARLG
jgi:hypothetical protein